MRGQRGTGAAALIGIALAAGLGIAPACAQRLDEAQITSELIGRKVAGVYPSGGRWSEDFNADGTTGYREPGRGLSMPGRWWLASGLFCFEYPRELSGGCFVVVKPSPNCYEVYTVDRAPRPGEPPSGREGRRSWNGRMLRSHVPQTCDEQPSS